MTSSFLGDFQTPSPCHHVIIRLAPPLFVSVNSEKNFSVTKQRTPVILILTFLRKPYFACSFVHWLQNCFCFPSTTFRIWASQIQYDIKCNRNRGLPTISNPPPPLPLKRLRHLWTAPYPLPLFLIGPPRTLDTWSWPVAIMPTRMIVIMNGCNKSLQSNHQSIKVYKRIH